MKKLLLSLPLVVTLLFAGCNDNSDNRYRITGYSDIDSLNGKWVYIFESLEAPLRAIDSAKIDNNKFTLSGVSLVQPYKAPIIVTNDGRMPVLPLIGAYIVVEPGEIEVSPFQEEMGQQDDHAENGAQGCGQGRAGNAHVQGIHKHIVQHDVGH